MASFEEKVEAITGLSIVSDSTPINHNKLSILLKDAVNDFTSKWISIHPQDTQLFTRSSSESESNAGLGGGIKNLISVVREAGSDNDWRDCAEIPIGLQSRVTDTTSMHYASKFNPVFTKGGDGSVLVYPAPTSSNNAYKIYYVNDVPVNSSDSALVYSHTDLNYFPQSLEYLVVLKTAISVLSTYLTYETEDSTVDTALSEANSAIDLCTAINDSTNTNVDSAVTALNSFTAEIELANAAFDKISVENELDNAEIDKATAELAECVANIDSNVDTAITAITTAAGRINTAIALANTEFDKGSDLLVLGEADSEGAINTALASMLTELGETQSIADLINTQIDSAVSEIALANAESDELATQTDNSGDFNTALAALNSAADKFRADGDDPALFGDEHVYTTGEGLTNVIDALNNAKTIIDDGANSPTGNAAGDAASYLYDEEDVELVQGAIAIAGSEMQRAQVEITAWNATIQGLSSEIQSFSTEVQARTGFSGAKSQAVQAYLGTANSYIAAAQGYNSELQSKLAIANGYQVEIQARLSQAQTKRQESTSRIELGNAYIQEAAASGGEVQSYVQDVQSRLSQVQAQVGLAQGFIASGSGYNRVANTYVAEGQAFLSVAQGYIAEANAFLAAAQGFSVEVQSRLAQASTYLQEAQVRTTIRESKVKRYAAQLQALSQQYNEAFLIGQPQASEGGK